MVTNDATIVHLKHKVMERVAKLAWEDNLNEQSMNDLCLEISPGPVAQYRCCVYKERTIISQRIRLSLAQKILSPGEKRQFDAASDPRRALLTFWVLKEAQAKFTGDGLRGYPNHTNFSLEDPRVTEIDGCLVAVIQ